MAFLEFTFQSFWHFVGVMILIGAVVQGLLAMAAIITAARGPKG